MSDLQISDLQTGISEAGMDNYITNIRTSVKEKLEPAMREAPEVIDAINQGWAGEAKDNFLKLFEKGRNKLADDMLDEFKNLEARLAELEKQYYDIDKNMIEME